MDSLRQYVLLLVFMSGAALNYADVYSDIRIAFPVNPCDNREIQMPNFYAPKRRISETKCLEYTWRLRYIQGRARNHHRYDDKKNTSYRS